MKRDVALTTCFAEDITTIVESFSEKDPAGKRSLQQLLTADADAFCHAAISILAKAKASAGTRYLVHLLLKHNLLLEALTNPEECPEAEAVAVASSLEQMGSPIGAELEKVLAALIQMGPSLAAARRILRVLTLMDASGSQSRAVIFQSELMTYPDPNVRSKTALVLGRCTKNTAWLGRLLLDEDERVQANAVEALWAFDGDDGRPLLLTAAKSPNHRVAGNAILGLYRISDLSSIRRIFEMAQHHDPRFRSTAVWVMGETQDPRFLPFLTERFSQSSGNERMAVLRALSQIRRRERALGEAGPVEIRISQAVVETDATRRLVFALRSPVEPDLGGIQPTQFALWADGTLVLDYSVVPYPNPALLLAGFVLPRFLSEVDPYGLIIVDAFKRCAQFKRPDDLWRIDRYTLDQNSRGPATLLEKANLPYDETMLGPGVRMQRGFLTSIPALEKIISSPGPRERAAADVAVAIERLGDAAIRISGKRQIFVFFHRDSCEKLAPTRRLDSLVEFVRDQRLVLHGIAPDDVEDWKELRDLCLTVEGSTFTRTSVEGIPDVVEKIFSHLLNKYEITYRVPSDGPPGVGTLLVSSDHGSGKITFSPAPPQA